jgi:hypothetical protein
MHSKALPAALFVSSLLAEPTLNYATEVAGNPLAGFCTWAVVVGGTLVGVWQGSRTPLDR